MHEWKNDYIFCFNAELTQDEAKDLITMYYGTGYLRLLCSMIFAHRAMALNMMLLFFDGVHLVNLRIITFGAKALVVLVISISFIYHSKGLDKEVPTTLILRRHRSTGRRRPRTDFLMRSTEWTPTSRLRTSSSFWGTGWGYPP